MFVQPTSVPTDVAFAIHAAVHDTATEAQWMLMQNMPWDELREHINAVFSANLWAMTAEQRLREHRWFQRQLGGKL